MKIVINGWGVRFNLLLMVAASLCLGTGCVRYRMTLTNSSIIDTKGKPKLNQEKNAYLYKDALGREGNVPAFKVKEIAPR